MSSPDDTPLLRLAARLWLERRGEPPPDEGSLRLELEDASPELHNVVVDALHRHGWQRFLEAVARVGAEVRS